MSTAIPIRPITDQSRPATLEDVRAELQALTGLVTQLQPGRPVMYQLPDRISKAVVQPEKYTSTLPLAVLTALRRYAAFRGGENINVIICEALRLLIPAEHFDAALDELMLEQKRLWAELATPAERMG